MKILVADDDTTTRLLLEDFLAEWGFTVLTAQDGDEAWDLLENERNLQLAVLDWMMPGVDGLEICRRIKGREEGRYIYTLLLTGKGSRDDMVQALESGADDYLTKPVNADELRSRLAVGQRILRYEKTLAEKIVELEDALREIRTLSGLLPICSSCKRIRDDQGYWNQIDTYIGERSDAKFSHSICPACQESYLRDSDRQSDP